jgi:hypothetical protein
MINSISEKIQAAVLSVGRTKEDLKKYTLNIEATAWQAAMGDQVRLSRRCSAAALRAFQVQEMLFDVDLEAQAPPASAAGHVVRLSKVGCGMLTCTASGSGAAEQQQQQHYHSSQQQQLQLGMSHLSCCPGMLH